MIELKRRPGMEEGNERLKILTFTTLYPNEKQPNHGVFVENRLRHLVADEEVSACVVAPVPWFPSSHPAFGSYTTFAGVPRVEERHGLVISHPRYPVIPKVGMSLTPTLMYLAVRGLVAELVKATGIDLIDAHYFYPDGVAAVMLGRELGLPVTITARGSDLNLIPDHRSARRQILWAARRAGGIVTVSRALKDTLGRLGFQGPVRVLRNGVDLEEFHPHDREAVRDRLGLRGDVLLSVGSLIPLKGHDIVIEALKTLPGTTLLIAGAGPMQGELEQLAARLDVGHRVRFLGGVPHHQLAEIYSAADALVLASSREGWPNVLLEAMACGTPVVASDVGGVAEVVTSRIAGRLVGKRSPAAFSRAIRSLLALRPSRAATRVFAEQFDWSETSAGQVALFRELTGQTVWPETSSRGIPHRANMTGPLPSHMKVKDG